MRFENTQVFNINGAMRGMRFPMKGIGDTTDDVIGEKDIDLARRLWRASEADNLAHSKFLRQIFVSVDITAPLYWWSEADTYKVATVANSESTMHKLIQNAKDLSLEDFEYDDHSIIIRYLQDFCIPFLQEVALSDLDSISKLRRLKQALPTSYLQKRHWTANYEVIRNMYNQRHNHRLREWSIDFVRWVKYTLPYSTEFLVGRKRKED